MNKKNTIQSIVDNNLCLSCGVCAAICSKKAIHFELEKGCYVAKIDHNNCIKCGLCYQICPGKGVNLAKINDDNTYFGKYKSIYTVQSKDKMLLKTATSGAFVTTLIKKLLIENKYDCAFLVNDHNYAYMVETKKIDKSSNLNDTPKSRYVQINHTKEIEYILAHKNEKIILVGTPCYFHAFIKLLKIYNLKRENYLFIGLFCDRTFTYHVWEYFEYLSKSKLLNLYFRDKKHSGYPGNVIVIKENGKEKTFSRIERMFVKNIFMPEGCLYCLDKLNYYADISVGDNYTGDHEDEEGSNSIIIRTKIGEDNFEFCKNEFNIYDSSKHALILAQKPQARSIRSAYIKLKNSEHLINGFIDNKIPNYEEKKKYKIALENIEIGNNKQFIKIRIKKLKYNIATLYRKFIKNN